MCCWILQLSRREWFLAGVGVWVIHKRKFAVWIVLEFCFAFVDSLVGDFVDEIN